MNEPHRTIGKGMFAVTMASGSWFAGTATWLDPIVRGVTFYGGALAVILTVISFAFDIRRKWKARNHNPHFK